MPRSPPASDFSFSDGLPWAWLQRWWGTQHFYACSIVANQVIFDRKRGPMIAMLSILVHVLTVIMAWCVAKSIAAPVLFNQVFQLVPPGDADYHAADLDRRLGRARSHHWVWRSDMPD